MKDAINVKEVVKKYEHFQLGPIDIKIPKGIIVGLIGENGAGKTTFIKSLLESIYIDEGSIAILDKNCSDKLTKEDIGVVLDNAFFPELLTPKNINQIMKSIHKKWDSSLFYQYLKDFGLNCNQSIKKMSKGMRKKLEIATSLAHHPKLLILDEPTSGLDPVVRNEVLDIFLSFIQNEENTILFSTHITSDLEHIADHIIFIDKGKKVLDKTCDEITNNYGILKCDENKFPMIDKSDILTYRKSKYSYEILINDRNKLKKKYKDCVIDQITLEDLMVLMIKGEKIC